MSRQSPFRGTTERKLVVALLACHAGLLAWIGMKNTPNCNEAAHLATGIYNWHSGRFDPFPTNPPLIRLLAALPVACDSSVTNWRDYETLAKAAAIDARPEWNLAAGFMRSNPTRAQRFFAWARWMLVPLSVLGGYFCWRWAAELFGPSAGLVALVLWCFEPNVLAWSATICPDAVAASLGVAAGYYFWRWLKQPDGFGALLAGIMLGFALLSKMTWLILFAAWPAVWLARVLASRRDEPGVSWRHQAPQLAGVLAVGLFLLNLGYAFEGTFTPIGKFTFVSRTLATDHSIVEGGGGGNRFANTWLASFPVPLPASYLRGIDLQKLDFEKGWHSYLFGQWKDHGWWYYYVVCAVLKVPLGIWVLGILAVGATLLGCGCGAARLDELVLLLPATILFVLVSSQTGFSSNFRYVLPAFPLLFVWIGKVTCVAKLRPCTVGALVTGGLAWAVTSSLWIYPHSMSYFNELAGGPGNGHRYLLHANVDWGQDIEYLRQWSKRHPEVKPLAVLGRDLFIDDLLIAGDNNGLGTNLERSFGEGTTPEAYVPRPGWSEAFVPKPGWYATSVHRIHDPKEYFQVFRRFQPVASVGYSIWIYHITLDEANRVRREMGLAEFTGELVEEGKDRLAARLAKSAAAAMKRTTPIRVAIFYDEREGDTPTKKLTELLAKEPARYSWTLIEPEHFQDGVLKRFDVVIVPGGSGRRQAEALGNKGRQAVREFVRNGGGYIGICAGAFLATTEFDWSLGLLDARTLAGERNVPGHEDVSLASRGAGTVKVELTNEGKEVFGNLPGLLDAEYASGPIFFRPGPYHLLPYATLARFRTEIWLYEPQKGTMLDAPAIIAGRFGKGCVLTFSIHPEETNGLETLVGQAIASAARAPSLQQRPDSLPSIH